MNLSEWQAEIGKWAARKFGHYWEKRSDVPSCIAHLREEVDELEADPTAEEIADCIILLLVIGQCLGVNVERALAEKHQVNQLRTWQPPDERGVVHHVPEGVQS